MNIVIIIFMIIAILAALFTIGYVIYELVVDYKKKKQAMAECDVSEEEAMNAMEGSDTVEESAEGKE